MKLGSVLFWSAVTVNAAMAHDMASHGHAMDGKSEWAAFGQPGKDSAAARTIAVGAIGMRYSVKAIDVKRGETIRFVVTNRAPVKHEFVIGTRAFHLQHVKEMAAMPHMSMDAPNSVDLKPGETKTLIWQFTQSGEFLFGCDIPAHFQAGMIGTLRVR